MSTVNAERTIAAACVAAVALAVAVAGCAGGTAVPQGDGLHGGFTVTARFPDTGARTIPADAQSIELAVTAQGSTTDLRPPVLLTPNSPTATIDDLVAGTSVTVTATAYPEAEGGGTAQAAAAADLVVPVGLQPLTLEMGVTVTSLVVSPTPLIVALGGAGGLTATATDGSGAMVLVHDAFQWTSADEAVATVDAEGVVTGVAAGTTEVTVTDPEADPPLSATATVVVCGGGVSVTITDVPPFGAKGAYLSGHVCAATPGDYTVAVYIWVGPAGGWWTKPTFDSPLTAIDAEGNFRCLVVSGGADSEATAYAVFVLPAVYTPPNVAGSCALPADLLAHAVASDEVERPDPSVRVISFAGHLWTVKSSDSFVGPGPNHFGDSEDDVSVDEDGRLHLHITHRAGYWVCSEIICTTTLGYGTYTFVVDSPVEDLDINTVGGFFTWQDCALEVNYREIDIELSRWGEDGAANAQFVVQPYTTSGNRHRYYLDTQDGVTAHSFEWRPGEVHFRSALGTDPAPADPGLVVQDWTYSGGDVPDTSQENVRINFWLLSGLAPTDGQDAELIVRDFTFVPAG
jgi:hypothetical protein